MFKKIGAFLPKKEAAPVQEDPEETLPETANTPQTPSREPAEAAQMASDQQAKAMEPQPPLVAEDRDTHTLAAADFSALLTPMQTQLEHLHDLFQEKIREDDGQRQLFERLMNELDEYRQDFIYSHITSRIFRELIQLYDTLEQTLQPDAVEVATRAALLSRLSSFRQQVLRTLQRQEVELLESVPGEPFDEGTQEAIDVRPVARPEEDGTVVEIVRRGFRYKERLLRPEWVIVGRYQNQ